MGATDSEGEGAHDATTAALHRRFVPRGPMLQPPAVCGACDASWPCDTALALGLAKKAKNYEAALRGIADGPHTALNDDDE